MTTPKRSPRKRKARFKVAIQILILKWDGESKRIWEMYQKYGDMSLLAQSYRYWNCARELEQTVREQGPRRGGSR